MKAFVLEKYGSPLPEVEMPVPTPAARELLVRMVASGVNHTGEHVYGRVFHHRDELAEAVRSPLSVDA